MSKSKADHNKMLIDRIKGATPIKGDRFAEFEPRNPNVPKTANDNAK